MSYLQCDMIIPRYYIIILISYPDMIMSHGYKSALSVYLNSFVHQPLKRQHMSTMTAEKSTTTQLLELIRQCDRSADNIIRRKYFQDQVRVVIQRMTPDLLIDVSAFDALQVRLYTNALQIMNYINTFSGGNRGIYCGHF